MPRFTDGTTVARTSAPHRSLRETTHAYLAVRPALISAHEHAGVELVYHRNDAQHTYRQSVPDLMALLGVLGRGLLPEPPGAVGALILPMPYYRRFKPAGAPVDPANCGRIIRARNRELLDACARFRADNPPSAGLPMPALMADPFRDAADFASDYADRLGEVFALKWHPSAAESPVSAYVERGYLALAADLDVPTVMHCAPEGRLGGLAEIAEAAVPAAVAEGARISLAHLAFDSPALPLVLNTPGVYADLGPWEAVCEQTVGDPGPLGSDARLARLIAECGPRLMVSFDTPLHLQHTDDGRVFGADTVPAMRRILGSLDLSGTDPHALLAGNALPYLFGTS
ncbi:hypothetical protein [Streptomyces sp. NPDC001401]|uniref:hypothetical protein n=1 Tax=Streptomyces sp. NPDC001401 TaxID=3364570 RepID=UPI0036AA8AC1